MPVVLGVLLLSGACGDWTESENLDFRRPTPEEQNPEAYRLYLAAVRAYKQQPHKVAMMTVKGSAERPSLQNQHLMAMPDSVDFICVEGDRRASCRLVGRDGSVARNEGYANPLHGRLCRHRVVVEPA